MAIKRKKGSLPNLTQVQLPCRPVAGCQAGECVSNFSMQMHHLEILLNSGNDSIGPGWTLRVFISNEFPSDADATGPWTTACWTHRALQPFLASTRPAVTPTATEMGRGDHH